MKTRDRKGSLTSKKTPDSFFRTITNSSQWKDWEDHQALLRINLKSIDRRLIKVAAGAVYDMAEVLECGWISQAHFQDFMRFSAIEYMLRLGNVTIEKD